MKIIRNINFLKLSNSNQTIVALLGFRNTIFQSFFQTKVGLTKYQYYFVVIKPHNEFLSIKIINYDGKLLMVQKLHLPKKLVTLTV